MLKIEKILVLGMGKVGSLVATLLSDQFEVVGADVNKPHYDHEVDYKTISLDVSNEDEFTKVLKNFDAVVSALPYFLNKEVARIACALDKHYFDLTEDVETTNYIRDLATSANAAILVQHESQNRRVIARSQPTRVGGRHTSGRHIEQLGHAPGGPAVRYDDH